MGTANEKYNPGPVDSQEDPDKDPHYEDELSELSDNSINPSPDNDRSVIANGSVIHHVKHIEHYNTPPKEEVLVEKIEIQEEEIRRTSLESVEKDTPDTPHNRRSSTPDTPPNSPSLEILVDIDSEFPDPPSPDRRYSLPDNLPDPIPDNLPDPIPDDDWNDEKDDIFLKRETWISDGHLPTKDDPIQTNKMSVVVGEQPLLNSEMEQALRELEGGCCCESVGTLTPSVAGSLDSEDVR